MCLTSDFPHVLGARNCWHGHAWQWPSRGYWVGLMSPFSPEVQSDTYVMTMSWMYSYLCYGLHSEYIMTFPYTVLQLMKNPGLSIGPTSLYAGCSTQILGGLPLRWWKIKELTYYLLVYGVLYIHKRISVNKKFVNGNSWVAYRTSTLYCLGRLTILWFACGDRLGYNMIFSKYSQCTTSNWKLLSGSVSNRLFRLSAI